MTTFCALHGRPGASALTWVWRRPAEGGRGAQGRWVRSGYSCNVPAAQVARLAARPVLTPGMVQRAFRQLRFAPPTVRIQPEGFVTLVNLETFYRVQWASGGYEPGEVASVVLLGRRVQLRPAVTRVTYRFGDGQAYGPTQDLGGTYPDGGVRHTYRRSGAVAVSATVTYSGHYALGPGAWRDVVVEVPVAGPPTQVLVKQARGRLVSGRR